jgi:putative ABC transport system substrate-binding protein
MMDRRALLIGAVAAFAAPLDAEARQAPIRARIGVFFSGSPQTAFEQTWGRSFVSSLRDLGWVENQNLALEWRYSEDREDRRRAIVEEFVRLKVNVIVVQSTPETAVTKQVTKTIPVVMVLVGDPVDSGLVDSLARPGGNITGTSLMATDTAAKRLELLREIVPMARRVAILGNPRNAAVARSWTETQDAGSKIGMKMISVEVQTHDDVARAFAGLSETVLMPW